MAYIRTIPAREAQGPLADLYRRFGNPDGGVDNVVVVHSLNPESLEAHMALYVQAMHRPSPLSRAEREILGCVASRLNGCTYCLEHHAAGLERLMPPERRDVVRAVKTGISKEELTPREKALVGYAEKLTSTPDRVTQQDVEALRRAGLSDREIVDAAQVVAYFAYANRIVLGLGATLETDTAPGQWPSV